MITRTKAKKIKIVFHSLGCKLNYAEGSHLAKLAMDKGFDVSEDISDDAQVYTINTCSVTENADKECRHLVRRIKRKHPDSVVVVTGCYAQLQPELIAKKDGVDMVLGVSEKFRLLEHIETFLNTQQPPLWGCHIDEINTFEAAVSCTDRTRAFLKVQDGCDYSCSFCTIPQARGRSRSDSTENVMRRISQLGKQCVQEVVLTGINLGDFRNEDGRTFFDLLQAIERSKTSVPRFRISSIEPNLLSDAIIDLVAESQRILPHFHIPLQSGSNNILSKMRRRYQAKDYADCVHAIKQAIPHCGIGVDVIVGFPGETEGDFEKTHQFLSSLPISYLHVFTYSERPNTNALTIDQSVPLDIRRKRNQKLRILSTQKMNEFSQSQKGSVRPVLFESGTSVGESKISGYTDNYIRVKTTFDKCLQNTIVPWVV